MSFFNEVILKLGMSPENCIGGYKVSLFDGKGIFVEGHTGVSSYSSEEIRVRIKKEVLIIAGSKLKIIEMNDCEIYIGGNIVAVSRGVNG